MKGGAYAAEEGEYKRPYVLGTGVCAVGSEPVRAGSAVQDDNGEVALMPREQQREQQPGRRQFICAQCGRTVAENRAVPIGFGRGISGTTQQGKAGRIGQQVLCRRCARMKGIEV